MADLSRDHHQALVAAMRMKRADPEGLDRVRAEVLAFWRDHGAGHFRVEEEVLLPTFARHADPAQDAVVTVLVDHVWIRERMDRLARGELDLAGVRELGERLEAHVHHEERILFRLIEATLDPDSLADLAERLAAEEGV
jgi:hypothetical protein